MKRLSFCLLIATSAASSALAQELTPKQFTTIHANAITPVKNQWKSGTCWDYATLGLIESELLRTKGQTYDLCEMFVVNKDYMDCATHHVRMHGYSEVTEGGSADDVFDVVRTHGICPEEAMPAPGSLTGDTLANFTEFIKELTPLVQLYGKGQEGHPYPDWQLKVQNVIDQYVGTTPETFTYQGKQYTPKSFAASLGLDWTNYVSLTSFTHHPFYEDFVIEAPYKWRLKPSYNIPIDKLMQTLDAALLDGYCVAWGGDVSGDFQHNGLAELPANMKPTQELRQQQFDNWQQTYDHVMLIYGMAHDDNGKTYYMVKNSWGEVGMYQGIWYMSDDYLRLNTTYIFLCKDAVKGLF